MDERKTIYLDDALEAIRKLPNAGIHWLVSAEAVFDALLKLPSAQPEIIQCKDCKHNPKESWFECPMSLFSKEQRPETAWCWKGERKDDKR